MTEQDRKFYGKYLPLLIEKEKMLMAEIKTILDSISTNSETALAEHVKSRIKSAESMREKLKMRGFDDTVENGLTNLSDIIGLRIVLHFVGDVYTMLEKIRQSDKWKVVAVKDYIANAKPNGYRSLHIILSIPFECGETDHIETEIQLRTIAMDCWASLEHQLKYKKNITDTELIVSELKRCADEMTSTDLTMQTIRELIQKQENR